MTDIAKLVERLRSLASKWNYQDLFGEAADALERLERVNSAMQRESGDWEAALRRIERKEDGPGTVADVGGATGPDPLEDRKIALPLVEQLRVYAETSSDTLFNNAADALEKTIHDHLKQAQATIEQMQETANAHENRYWADQARIAELEKQNAVYVDTINCQTVTIAADAKRIEARNERIAALETQLADCDIWRYKLSGRIAALEGSNERLRGWLENATKQGDKLEGRIEALEGTLREIANANEDYAPILQDIARAALRGSE